MIISLIENSPNTPHGGKKLGNCLAMTLSVVQPRQCHTVLIWIVKPPAMEIVFYVALNRKNHCGAFGFLIGFLLLHHSVRASVRPQIVLLAQILGNTQ